MRWLLLLAACSSASHHFSPVDSDGRMLRDGQGRTLLLRGVNARVDGVFDVKFDDGRAPREAIPAFDAGDVQALRDAGFNLLRLPLSWSGLEPMPGQYSTEYLDRVAAIVELLRGSGVYVLLDLHQDGYSKELCEDGAPLWAINPPPMLVGGPGPLQGATDCHTSSEALQAFQSFFADTNMLREKYAAMAQALARRFAKDTQVLGYEVMNEPIGDDDTIAAFSADVARSIRAVDPDHLVLFEPSATRNFTNGAPLSATPFAVAGGVYSVHVYTGVFGSSTIIADGTYAPQLSHSIAGAREEADSWKTPLVLTEFGIGADNPKAGEWLGHFLDDADEQLASWTLWLWKEQSQGNWGLYTHEADDSWTPRPGMFDAVSRPYAQAVAGELTSMKWDGTSLTVQLHGGGTHDIFWNRGTPSFTCDGQSVSAQASGNVYRVACNGSTLITR